MLGAVAEPGLSFAGLLRQLRAEARLTQEELAEAAGLSARSVSDLERGIHCTAHKDTALLLAGALNLAGPVRERFVSAARGRGPAADVLAARGGGPGAFAAAATRALPRDIAAFTGRQAELARLIGPIDALAAVGGVVGIHAVGGMAGVGKTTFAVRRVHREGGLAERAVLLAAACPHRRAPAGGSGRCAGQLAADRRGARGADPARAGRPGRPVA